MCRNIYQLQISRCTATLLPPLLSSLWVFLLKWAAPRLLINVSIHTLPRGSASPRLCIYSVPIWAVKASPIKCKSFTRKHENKNEITPQSSVINTHKTLWLILTVGGFIYLFIYFCISDAPGHPVWVTFPSPVDIHLFLFFLTVIIYLSISIYSAGQPRRISGSRKKRRREMK